MREYIDILEDKLQDIENRKRFIFLILLIFLILIAIYFLLIEPAILKIEQSQEQIENLDRKIAKISPKKLKTKIYLKKKEIMQNESLKEELKLKLLLLKSKFDRMGFLFVNNKDFNKFLDSLLKNSVNKNILIKNIEITEKNDPYIGKLKVKKMINVNGSGEFLNIVSFVRGLETNKMLMIIKEFNIETNGSIPNFSFNIDFYGVE